MYYLCHVFSCHNTHFLTQIQSWLLLLFLSNMLMLARPHEKLWQLIKKCIAVSISTHNDCFVYIYMQHKTDQVWNSWPKILAEPARSDISTYCIHLIQLTCKSDFISYSNYTAKHDFIIRMINVCFQSTPLLMSHVQSACWGWVFAKQADKN